MTRKGPRQLVFVCASIASNGDLLTKIIPAASPAEATQMFTDQFSIAPKEVLGPFFKKRAQVLEITRELKFTNQNRKAIYNDWIVTAFILKEPEDQAYLVFIKRVDDKKLPTPKGTITVPVSDLRFI
jgi:hypothetical protein